MQIEALKVFCDLAETESFTKAAQLNDVSQSAVSQGISALERQFKSILVERSKKQFRLTREGKMLYDCSKDILATYEALFRQVRKTSETVSGNIRMAALYSIGLYDLPPYLKTFLKAYPTVHVDVQYRHTSQIYEDVVSNGVDLGLVAFPHRQYNLGITPLRKEPMVLICHPDHPFAKARSVRLKELRGQKFIHFAPDTPTRRAVERLLGAVRTTVQPVMEFDNIETVKRAVEIDAGLAIVPQPTVAVEVANKTLAEVPLEGKSLFRPLAAIHRANRELSLACKQFLAILKGEQPAKD